VEICEFNALAKLGDNILVFPQLCHGCGSCTLQCPEEAIHEEEKPIGILRHGRAKPHIDYYEGELTISEPMPTPIIRQLKHFALQGNTLTLMDSPPGASCSVVATIHDADFVILVTEPTPFGLHDLKQMLGILEKTKSPAGVIINRDGIGDDRMETFLANTPYPIMMRIPYELDIAAGLAAGLPLTDIKPGYKNTFKTMFDKWIAPYTAEKGTV
jgi:MinD superfamily P-loop ATPase